jgi:uncharacterized protein with von Willebrand factor type A (vWA) domain
MPNARGQVPGASGDAEKLADSVVGFVRLLRDFGLSVSPAQSADLLAALTLIDITSRADVYAACRCLLVKRHGDLAIFDLAFAIYWRAPGSQPQPAPRSSTSGRPGSGSSPPADPTASDVETGLERTGDLGTEDGRDQSDGPPNPSADAAEVTGISHIAEDSEVEAEDKVFTYSAAESLWDKSLNALTTTELAEAERLLSETDWGLPKRKTRRTLPSARGSILDQRRTAREGIRLGGEVVHLYWRKRPEVTRSLIFIADASGSMEPYTKILLRFAHVLRQRYSRAEAFVFSTRLTRITRDVDTAGPDTALRRVSEHVEDLAGGTRIGDALHTFNRVWSRRVLGRGAIVVIISDGWDRGDLELLAHEIAHLQRSCYRLVWLNPLLGHAGYVPQAAGMTTALPYIDDFMPAHNLASLRALVKHLATLDSARPVRAQSARLKVS